MKQTITVEKSDLRQVNSLLRGPAEGCGRDECFFEREAHFPGGIVMLVQAIASTEPESGGWTQGVLFERDENELMIEVGCTDVGETFDGEYIVEHDGTEYAVSVVEN